MNEPPPRRADHTPGMVPGWGGTCLPADLPRPLFIPYKGGFLRTP